MTDSNLRDREPSSAGAWLMRSLPSPNRNATVAETVSSETVSLDTARQPLSSVDEGRRRDWSASLDLIHEATAAIRISEERANELEEELERTVAQFKARESALEAQISVTQSRAELAERRAAEAEDWLGRMHDAVVDGFTRREPRTTSPPAASSAT
ncbi:hypothetical protein [Methylobacterium flocculans]|uniref:hypothetical protein n=1 Tax=Methylobacterium flocculans TaxID=2984843 RepID=UPI0021F2A369|nr:hypothetical protein [Methylobacterium sp. FF17]